MYVRDRGTAKLGLTTWSKKPKELKVGITSNYWDEVGATVEHQVSRIIPVYIPSDAPTQIKLLISIEGLEFTPSADSHAR